MNEQPTLLIVDDEPANLQVLNNILGEQNRLLFSRDGQRALTLAASEFPDLILLDVMMPDISGYDVCRQLKASPATVHIPVIFVTALSQVADEAQGLEAGAVDYLTKPVSPAIVRARVRTHLSLVHTEELKKTRLSVVQRLGRAAEYKDNETGRHVIRMSLFSQIIGRRLGLSESWLDDLLNAAPMHDIGKIGIPDAVLLKPDKLDEDEWKIMQTHAAIGAEIIGEDGSSLLRMARDIALCHHEKWDGSGYPQGLSGEDIPLEARIVALADVFDALTSERPYKKAWPIEQATALIREQSGKHFDPQLVEVFFDSLPDILTARAQWLDQDVGQDGY